MRWCARAYGLKFVSLRYFNACGAHSRGHIGEAHNPESHLIPLILQASSYDLFYFSVMYINAWSEFHNPVLRFLSMH